MVIRDKQTGEEFEGPDGTPFDSAKYELVPTPEERPPGPGQPRWEHDLEKQVERTYGDDGKSWSQRGADLIRVGGPMAAGQAISGGTLGPILQALVLGTSGAASEATAQAVEGSPFNLKKVAVAGAVPAATPTARAVVEGARGGVPRMKEALATGGKEVVNSAPLTDAADAITRRLGNPPTSPAGAKLAENVRNRPQPMDLQGVEDVRRAVGDRVASGVKSGRSSARQLYGASKEVMEQHGSPSSEMLLEGISAEGARKALVSKPSLRELLAGLGILGLSGGGAMWSGDWRAALPALYPVLLRLYNATNAVGNKPLQDAAVGAGLSRSLNE